jgi:hypothetical protein
MNTAGFLYVVEPNIKLAHETPFALHAHIIEPADPFYEKLKPVVFCLVDIIVTRFPQITVI